MLIPVHVTAGLPAGQVTRGHVWEATSSPGNLTTATLTGAEVRRMLERGPRRSSGPTPHAGRGAALRRPAGGRWGGRRRRCGSAAQSLEDDRTYRVTGSDLELSVYGTLVDQTPEDLDVRVPAILPELLESYLRSRPTAG